MAKTAISTDVNTDTALVVPANTFIGLQPDNEAREAMLANMMPGEGFEESDLVRVKTPAGGGTMWEYETLGNVVNTKTIYGVLAAFTQRGTLWPSEEPSESMPYLISDNLITARKVGDKIGDLDPAVLDRMLIKEGPNAGLYDWRGTEEGGPNIYNDYGSSSKGRGKRCKESRVMFILTPDSAFPLVVRAQPGSLRNIKPFIKMLPVPHFRAVIELSLFKETNAGGQPFSQIIPRYIGDIGREAGKMVMETYTTPLKATAVRMSSTASDSGLGE